MSSNLPIDFSVIREVRKDSGMTLGELSKRSKVSIASLSKLERNQTTVGLDTLLRIAKVFGLSASDLLSLAESRTSHRKAIERYQSGPFDFEKLSWQGVDLFHASAKAGNTLKHPEAHGDEHEICWVRSGRIHIAFSHEEHDLGPGEAIKFDAVLPHTYEVVEDTELIIAHLTKPHRF
ncbi:MAG: XRE family transcriptional regulator [Verrucomicrobiota bacterium]